MNTIAHLSGSPLQEADNHGLGSSLLVTDNPTNANNDREIKYIDSNNMQLGTVGNSIAFDGSQNTISIKINSNGTINLGSSIHGTSSLDNVNINSKNITLGNTLTKTAQGDVSLSSGGSSLYTSELLLPNSPYSTSIVTTKLTGRNDILIKTNDVDNSLDKITLQSSNVIIKGQLVPSIIQNQYIIRAKINGANANTSIRPTKIEVLNNTYNIYYMDNGEETLWTSGGISDVEGYVPSGNFSFKILNDILITQNSNNKYYYFVLLKIDSN